MGTVVNVESLNRELVQYQKDMIVLPYALLIPVLMDLKVSMLGNVVGKDVVIVKERAGGAAAPYTPGQMAVYKNELSRMYERKLEPELCYAAVKDNILNYRKKNILFDAEKNKVDNKTKAHPLERDIISDAVIITAEDIIDALYFASRNEADPSPLGMVDGIYTLQDALVTAGAVSEAAGNLVACGSLATPANASDITAYISLRNWLRAADPKIKNKPLILQISNTTLTNVKDALENKRNGHSDTNFNTLLDALRSDCNLPQLMISSHYCLGTGSRLTLTTPGNFDIGFNTLSDIEFMKIRTPWEDPNMVQFWIQWEMAMRIKNFNKRGFMISDGTTVGNEMSGDYDSGSGSGTGLIGV
jgi:hypothetical protein